MNNSDYSDYCDYKEDNMKKRGEINKNNDKKSNENDETLKRINEEIEWYKANGTTKEEASKEYAKYAKN